MNEWIKNNKIEIVSKIKYVFTEEKKKKKRHYSFIVEI